MPIGRFARDLTATVAGMSVVSSTGLACGGVTAGVAEALGKNPYLWFMLGFLVASGITSLVLLSNRVVLLRLRHIKDPHEQNLITQREAAQLRRALLRWYSERMYGRDGGPEPDGEKSDDPPAPPA